MVYVKVVAPVTVIVNVPLYSDGEACVMYTVLPELRPCAADVVSVAVVPTLVIVAIAIFGGLVMLSAIRKFLYVRSDLAKQFGNQFGKSTNLFAKFKSQYIGMFVVSPLFRIGMPDKSVEVHWLTAPVRGVT